MKMLKHLSIVAFIFCSSILTLVFGFFLAIAIDEFLGKTVDATTFIFLLLIGIPWLPIALLFAVIILRNPSYSYAKYFCLVISCAILLESYTALWVFFATICRERILLSLFLTIFVGSFVLLLCCVPFLFGSLRKKKTSGNVTKLAGKRLSFSDIQKTKSKDQDKLGHQ